MFKIIFLAVLVNLLAILAVFSTTASALNTDQRPVIDDAGIFDGRIVDVEGAAGRLISAGADVRIRTITTYGSNGNLDLYESQLEKQSPSWKGQDGDRKNNLIVLIIAVQERQTGLYYGSLWDTVLSSQWLRIQTDIMNPLFRTGDYATGVINGIQEMQRLITGSQAATRTTTQSATAPAPVQTQTLKGNSSGWVFAVAMIVIVALTVGAIVFIYIRKKRARISAARQRALLPKQAAASGINELNQAVQMLEIKVNVTSAKISEDEAAQLKDGLEKARVLVDQGSQRYAELSHSAGDPENPRLDQSQLDVIQREFQKIVENLRLARESINSVEDKISVIQKAISDFPVRVAEISTGIEALSGKQEQIKQAGFKISYPAELLATSRDTLDQARDLFATKRFKEGLRFVDLAAGQLKKAEQAGDDLPRKKQEAEVAISALHQRIDQVEARIDKGRKVFEGILQTYAETTWEPVRGNGTEAENRIDWAKDALEGARSAFGPDQQEYFKALELMEKGNGWLNEAEALMKSISDLDGNLSIARHDAPAEIESAQADITKAWDYIKTYDDDIRESLEDDLRAAEKKNEVAREELNQTKPDFFKVVKMAREANDSADNILVEARNDRETAERLRTKAVSARRDAGARVSIASTYIEVHHPVVRDEARNYLVNATDALRQAESASDTNSQIELATRAESAAERAYSLAQADVNSTTMSIPHMSRPTIIVPPPMPRIPMGNPPWGARQSSRPMPGNFGRPGGGSSGWGGGGGGGGRKGGGSTGW